MFSKTFFILLFLCCMKFYGQENLLSNGNFDSGSTNAQHWEDVDNLTSFWINETGRGRVLKLDSRIDRKQALAWKQTLKGNNKQKPPEAIIPENKLKSIGSVEGAVIDSELIDVIPGQTYKLSVDIKGKCGMIVWIKGFMQHPRCKQLVDSYQTRLTPENLSDKEWKTYSINFSPTKRMPKTSKMKVRIFVYWPVGIAYFDNVRITKLNNNTSK